MLPAWNYLLGLLAVIHGALAMEYVPLHRGVPGVDFPVFHYIPPTKFFCPLNVMGEKNYYADVETGCQVFHVCDDTGKESFLCSPGTLFNQKTKACDFWYKVTCPTHAAYLQTSSENVLKYQEPVWNSLFAKFKHFPTKAPCPCSSATKPTASTQKPSTPCPNSTTKKPTPSTQKPTTPCPSSTTRKPTTSTQKPTTPSTTTRKPTPSTQKPKTPCPSTTTKKPTPSTQKPSTPCPSTTTTTKIPTPSTQKPTTPCPSTTTKKPIPSTQKPSTPCPSTMTKKPTPSTQKPTTPSTTTRKPTTSTQKPTTPCPSAITKKPTTTTTSTTTQKPTTPSTTTKKSTPSTQKPTTPCPSTTTKKPTPSTQKPTTPCPSTTTKKPTTSTQKPTTPSTTTRKPTPSTQKPTEPCTSTTTKKPTPSTQKPTTPCPSTTTKKPTPSTQKPTTPCPNATTERPAPSTIKSSPPCANSSTSKPSSNTQEPTRQPTLSNQSTKNTIFPTRPHRRQLINNIQVHINAEPRIKTSTYVLMLKDGSSIQLTPVSPGTTKNSQKSSGLIQLLQSSDDSMNITINNSSENIVNISHVLDKREISHNYRSLKAENEGNIISQHTEKSNSKSVLAENADIESQNSRKRRSTNEKQKQSMFDLIYKHLPRSSGKIPLNSYFLRELLKLRKNFSIHTNEV